MTAATPGQAARERLASAVHDLFGADCPNEPCPQCARREAELMDLADDYAGAGLPDSPLAADNTRLRKEGDLLRGQLQAVRRLMEDAAANGMIDSRAILDLIAAAPAAPQPAPELAAAMRETRELRERLTLLATEWDADAAADEKRVRPTPLSETRARVRRDLAACLRKGLEGK